MFLALDTELNTTPKSKEQQDANYSRCECAPTVWRH